MKKMFFGGICLASLLLGTLSYAEEKGTTMDQEESKAVEVGNQICPVSGNKVGEMGEIVKYEYKGKIYNLCCPACIKDFKKDPEKYSKIAEEEVNGKKLQETPDTHNIHNHNNS